MTRETRLSPRRAWKALSRLPLSPRRTQVRLKPLLFLRPHPPKDGKPRSETPRFCAHREHPFFDARLRSAWLAARVRLSPTALLQHEEYRLRLKPPTPLSCSARGSPRFKSSTRLAASSRLLHRSIFAPCQPDNCRFRFGKKNCNANQFFSPTRESIDSWRETQPGPAEAATAS